MIKLQKHTENISAIISPITYVLLILIFSGCTRQFDKTVSKYPLMRQVFMEKWCVIVNPFTASPQYVKGFTPKESKALTLSFCQALKKSGLAVEADIHSVKLCKKRILVIDGRINKRVIDKEYMFFRHAFLFCIPTLLGWPTAKEKCEFEVEIKVRIKGERQIVGMFSAKYNYNESSNLYKSDAASPVLNPSIPLTAVFSQLIEGIEDTLAGKKQPEEIIVEPSPKKEKEETIDLSPYLKPNSEEPDPNIPVIPKIPGTPGMLTPSEPIPWDSIF